ncbi:MAG: ribose 5-phosphate isomerase B [Eubacteriales bacterium]
MSDKNKKIAVACDHGGYELKLELLKYLEDKGYEVVDFGTHDTKSVNYPDYAHYVCSAIQKGEAALGILVCGTGIGMSMAANKHTGIRAACCSDTYSARLTRMHNDANVLCLGGRVLGSGLALDIAELFLTTEFEGGRHATRIGMLENYR